MSFVQGEEETNKIPVALGLKGKNLYLSCGMKDGKPILQLESVKPNTYPKRKMEKRFVFNKLEINHKCEFESAMYPNWYISTSRSELQPIFLGNTRSKPIICDKQNDTYQSNSAVESLDIKLEDIEEKAMVLSGSCVLKAVHLQRTQEDQQATTPD
ncbi:hypothetical protein HPG69_011242 [Diceros bicornis minor]|uniref:Multifunctional fusion protein n=1 Tax=Diceros bicornis minor TaxID=77932 RepID=A0A7J7FEL6_DICBM|nr:hypothetical protein HPG69_011242 [Diceros bicornis minor]